MVSYLKLSYLCIFNTPIYKRKHLSIVSIQLLGTSVLLPESIALVFNSILSFNFFFNYVGAFCKSSILIINF